MKVGFSCLSALTSRLAMARPEMSATLMPMTMLKTRGPITTRCLCCV